MPPHSLTLSLPGGDPQRMAVDTSAVVPSHSVKWQWLLRGQQRIDAEAFFASDSPLSFLPLLVFRSHDHRHASSSESMVGAMTLLGSCKNDQ